MAAVAIIEHGTARGYRQHCQLNVPSCDPCRDAERDRKQRDRAALRTAREHLVAIRRGSGLSRSQREAEIRAAQTRAIRRLAGEYPARLGILVKQELKAAGLT